MPRKKAEDAVVKGEPGVAESETVDTVKEIADAPVPPTEVDEVDSGTEDDEIGLKDVFAEIENEAGKNNESDSESDSGNETQIESRILNDPKDDFLAKQASLGDEPTNDEERKLESERSLAEEMRSGDGKSYTDYVMERVRKIIAIHKRKGRSSAPYALRPAFSEDEDSRLSEQDIQNVEYLLKEEGIRVQFYEKGGKQKVQFDW